MAVQRLNCLAALEAVQANEDARNVWEAYDASKAYVKYNKVAYQGSCYVCHTDAPAGTLPTNEAYFTLIAQGGQAATIAIGEVTTAPAGSPVSVTNTGDPNAAVLNFSIPAGADAGDGYADAIVCTAEGTPVVMADAAARQLRGLKIYGKTTQDGTPSPTAPVELVHVESPAVTVHGKNLALRVINFDNTSNGVRVVGYAESSEFVLDGTATKEHSNVVMRSEVLAAGTYTISVSGLNIHGSTHDRIYVAKETDSSVLANSIQDGKPKTFVLDEPTRVRCDMVFKAESSYENRTVKVQIEAGEAATEYEPHALKQQLALTYTLPAVPVTRNGNYTDADGQQWIADEVDFERGVHVQRVKTDTVTFAHDELNDRYTATVSADMGTSYGTATAIPVLCNVLKYAEQAGNGNPKVNGVRGAATSPRYIIGYHNGGIIGDAVVVYPLASPVETALPAELVTAYKALKTNYPNTVVSNDAGAWVAADYVADTKLYAGEHGSGGTVTPEQLERAIADYLAAHQISGTAARVATVNLLANGWQGAASPYSQIVTIAGVTPYSQVDLTPSIEQLAIFHDKDLAFVTENEDGVVTVYALGDKPQNDYAMQVTITEVKA